MWNLVVSRALDENLRRGQRNQAARLARSSARALLSGLVSPFSYFGSLNFGSTRPLGVDQLVISRCAVTDRIIRFTPRQQSHHRATFSAFRSSRYSRTSSRGIRSQLSSQCKGPLPVDSREREEAAEQPTKQMRSRELLPRTSAGRGGRRRNLQPKRHPRLPLPDTTEPYRIAALLVMLQSLQTNVLKDDEGNANTKRQRGRWRQSLCRTAYLASYASLSGLLTIMPLLNCG